jgi:hypothetical protein
MMNLSIITACIPSIKRFFADVQSGLMGVTISETYELTHSGGKPTQLQSGSGTGMGSRLASRFGISQNKSKGMSAPRSQLRENGGGSFTEAEIAYGNKARASRGTQQPRTAETESIKGLTQNVIHQKIDYDIEYEERDNSLGRGSR